jgi:hypothetical protein
MDDRAAAEYSYALAHEAAARSSGFGRVVRPWPVRSTATG